MYIQSEVLLCSNAPFNPRNLSLQNSVQNVRCLPLVKTYKMQTTTHYGYSTKRNIADFPSEEQMVRTYLLLRIYYTYVLKKLGRHKKGERKNYDYFTLLFSLA